MAKQGWRYIARRLNGDGTETTLDWNLPLSEPQTHDVLSGPLAIDGSISPEYARLKGPDGLPILRKWSTAIYAEEEGEIRCGGILSDIGVEGSKLTLGCIGFAGYPKGMPYTDSRFFVEEDPLNIVRHIWNHLQSQQFGNLGVVVDGTNSPKRIGVELEQGEFDTQNGPLSFESGPYKLEWFSTSDLGKNIDDLAADTPFDYHEEHSWDGDQIRHFIRIGYPTLGRRRTDLRFVLGENIVAVPQVAGPGETYANGVLLLGRGEGRVMVRGDVYEPDGGLRRIAVVQDKSQSTVAGAVRVARSELAKRQGKYTVSEIVVANHSHAPVGSYSVGDEILVQIHDGWAPIDAWCRILGISRKPDQSNDSTLTIARTDTLIS